jgi:hypothetical protein
MATSVTIIVRKEQKLLAALPTALPDATVVVGGKRKTTATLAAEYQEHLDVEAELVALRTQLHATLTRARALRKASNANTLAVRTYAVAVLGETSVEFAALGFEPHKVGKPTIATKLVAIAKSHATREARHTLGARQKAAIHGAVAPTPPAPTPIPAPAPAAEPATATTTTADPDPPDPPDPSDLASPNTRGSSG